MLILSQTVKRISDAIKVQFASNFIPERNSTLDSLSEPPQPTQHSTLTFSIRSSIVHSFANVSTYLTCVLFRCMQPSIQYHRIGMQFIQHLINFWIICESSMVSVFYVFCKIKNSLSFFAEERKNCAFHRILSTWNGVSFRILTEKGTVFKAKFTFRIENDSGSENLIIRIIKAIQNGMGFV